MPLAEFPGRWNWGYDGVDLYAPAHVYGPPDDLRSFVDRAHALGLAVILDVVYNHFGPDGNYLKAFSDDYFTDRYKNEWGEAINFDGPGSPEVREFFTQNACYWIAEFHFDGLRLDATQCIYDSGLDHILAALSRRARETAFPRKIIITSENETQDVKLLAPTEKGGYGLDALWSDDFHHSARVAVTGRREAYYTDYKGEPQELLSLVKRGFLYQGQYYQWQKKERGTPVTSEPAAAFVFYTQNHDQVANHPQGERIQMLAGPSRCRTLAALMLLAPQTPLLFMGQEFAASSPFLYFADQPPELGVKVSAGRKEFLSQFPSYATPEVQKEIPDPGAESTFLRSKLNLAERETHAETYRLYQDLLRLRREDPVIAAQARERLDGAVVGPAAFVIRFFGEEGDRLLLVNLGTDLEYNPSPEPLLALPAGKSWNLIWSSEDPRYGGAGRLHPYQNGKWHLSGGSAVFLSMGDDKAGGAKEEDR
jgi:maltooligosyltrehalose trehalohydrolase